MTMILQLLVAAVAVGLGVHARLTPRYKQYVQAIETADETLEKNVLSMEGNIPLLNDYRRHYAEIVHVVNYHGLAASGCLRRDFYESYPEYLNESAPEAINQPEVVVNEIRKLQVVVNDNINELIQLINACVQEMEVCNELIDETVIANPDQFGYPATVLVAAGLAATELNTVNVKFEEVSKNLKAHQFVCTSPEDLQQIVLKVADLQRVLKPLRQC